LGKLEQQRREIRKKGLAWRKEVLGEEDEKLKGEL